MAGWFWVRQNLAANGDPDIQDAKSCAAHRRQLILRCDVLLAACCTWRSANANRSRARLGHFREDRLDRTGRFDTKEVVEVSKSSKTRASQHAPMCRVPTVIPMIPSHPVPLSLSHLISSNSPSHPSRPSIHPIRPRSSLTSQPTQAPRTPPPLPQRLPPPSRRAVIPTSLLFLIVLFPSESNAKARYAGVIPCPCNLGWTRLNFRRLLTYAVLPSTNSFLITIFSQFMSSLATVAFATFWCPSDRPWNP